MKFRSSFWLLPLLFVAQQALATTAYYYTPTGTGSTLFTSDWTGNPPALAYGGTGANLTASAGGIFYSTGSTAAILAGSATANQMLLSSSSAAPAWSVATWPTTTTINGILYSSAANTVREITTGNSSVLVTSSGGVPSFSTLMPAGIAYGTITSGIWGATTIAPTAGGTGVANNAANMITFSGNYGLGLTLSDATALTLPTSGTLATTANIAVALPATSGIYAGSGTAGAAQAYTMGVGLLGNISGTATPSVLTTLPSGLTIPAPTIANGLTLNYTGLYALSFQNNGTPKDYLGLAFTANDWVSGSAVNDLVFRNNGGNFDFTTNNGASMAFQVASTGQINAKALTLAPAAGTVNPALTLNQSLSGTVSDGFEYGLNSIIIASDNAVAASSGTGAINDFYIYHLFGGAVMEGGRNGLFVYLKQTAASSSSNPNRYYVASTPLVETDSGDGGTGLTKLLAEGFYFGQNPQVRSSGANTYQLTGAEFDIINTSTSSQLYSWGVVSANLEAASATFNDSAFIIYTGDNFGIYGPGLGWGMGITFGEPGSSLPPVKSTGTLIGTYLENLSNFTVANEIDFSKVLCTNYAWQSTGTNINCAGSAQFSGLTLNNTSAYSLTFQNSGASENYIALALAGNQWATGSTTNDLVFRNSGSNFDFTTNNGTSIALQVQSNGGISVGNTTNPGAGGLDLAGQIYAPAMDGVATTETGYVCFNLLSTPAGKLVYDTTTCLSSKREWKKDEQPLSADAARAMVMGLQPKTFEWRDPKGPNQAGPQIGMIAEDVEQAAPFLASRDNKGEVHGWQEAATIAVLVKVVQDQQWCLDSWKCRLFGWKR